MKNKQYWNSKGLIAKALYNIKETNEDYLTICYDTYIINYIILLSIEYRI